MSTILSRVTHLSYGLSATVLGFLTHPYQTMQKVVEKDVPLAFVFFPAFLCVLGWLFAHEMSSRLLAMIPLLGLWLFIEWWWLMFWGLWQVTLLYLFWRFSSIRE